MTFTPERRQALLDACFALMTRRLWQQLAPGDAEEGRRLAQRLSELDEEYRAGVPVLALSRCPFCLEITRHSIDPFGLDGLWWDYKLPIRPLEEPSCPHYVGLTGAVTLDRGRIAEVPVLAVPGPEVPFVIARLVRQPSVRVVVSSMAIGPHRGYPICYFADPMPAQEVGVDTWGCDHHATTTHAGRRGWAQAFDEEDDYDYELRPWLEQEQLLYIRPGDETLDLRRGAAGCPYLDLPGRRAVMRIQHGRVWSDPSELESGRSL